MFKIIMPVTPTIDQLPNLSAKEKKALQTLFLADINYKCKTRRKPVSPKRKIVFFLLLKGYKITDALRAAQYSPRTIQRASTHEFLKSRSTQALATHYNLDKLRSLNLDYTLDRVTQIIEAKDVSHRDAINALKLLANLKGQLKTIFDINVNESMRVEVILGDGRAPAVDPGQAPAEIDAGGAALVPPVPAEVIEGEFVVAPLPV